jgi:DNA-binding GntR family transcriptional regulator
MKGRQSEDAIDLEPVDRPSTLTDMAYRTVKQALMRGVFSPGQKITSRGMAAALGISATPAREAIGRLVAERALESTHSRAFAVPMLSRTRIEELRDIRSALEGLAAERAADHLREGEIAILEQVQKEHEEARRREDYKAILERNEVFHFTIYRASDMPTLIDIIETLWVQIGPSLNLLYPYFKDSQTGVRNHHEALHAIRAHDGRRLRRAIEQDLADGARHLIDRLEVQGAASGLARS